MIFYTKDIFSEKIIKYKYNLSITRKRVEYESLYYAPKGQLKLLFERDSEGVKKWGLDITGAKKIIADMTRDNCSVISAGAQAKHPVFKILYDYLSNRFKGIITASSDAIFGYISERIEKDELFKEKLLKLLATSDIGKITDIKIKDEPIPDAIIAQLPPEFREEVTKGGEKPHTRELKFIHSYDKDYELSINAESAGTKRLMNLSVPLMDISSSNSFLIIDELENSLHQLLVENFIEIFLVASSKSNMDSQLLFTTHNQELLDSGLLRDDEIWFCHKNDKGESIYNSITDFTGIRKDVSRKKLYQSGKFGALPNVDMVTLTELFSAEKNR